MAEGHRQRLKDRFLKEGLDNFEQHNALELLLFYTLPRVDTNPIAHELIDRFGSFSGVLDAQPEELMSVNGISEHTATFLKLIPEVSRFYLTDKQIKTADLSSLTAIGDFLVRKYVGIITETVYMLLLDNKYSLISCIKVHDGSVSSAAVSIRKMAEIALNRKACAVVLAHNHPGGLPIPSPDDINVTHTFENALNTLEIHFVDHYIIADDKYCTILHELPREEPYER